jgi:hypothetical protein
MYKMIIDHPDGFQELIEVGEGGGYYDASKVVWHERDDGELTKHWESQVGSLVAVTMRGKKDLVPVQSRQKEYDAALKKRTSGPSFWDKLKASWLR